MPRILIGGARLEPGLVGPRQVVANPTTKTALPPIHVDACRNGKHPNASVANAMNNTANAAAMYRSKELFSVFGRTQQPVSSITGSRKRWRFAFRTGPMTHAIYAVVVMLPPTDGYDQPTGAKLTVYSDTAEATSVGTATFTYGPSPTGSSTAAGIQYWKEMKGWIAVSPSTDYYAAFSDETYGRLHSATVFDLQSMTENFDGYLAANLTHESEIYDVHRSNLAELTRNIWKEGAAKVLSWSVNDGTAPVTIASSTATNVIDQSSTSVSSSTPGFAFDMRNKARLAQLTSGVPVVMKAFVQTTDLSGRGRIYLKDSAGNVVLQITDPSFVSAAGWASVTGVLPATQDKYDLMHDNGGGGTQSLYAVSIYEYET